MSLHEGTLYTIKKMTPLLVDYAGIVDELPDTALSVGRAVKGAMRNSKKRGTILYERAKRAVPEMPARAHQAWNEAKERSKQFITSTVQYTKDELGSWMYFEATQEPRYYVQRDGTKEVNPIYPSVRQTKLRFNYFLRDIESANTGWKWHEVYNALRYMDAFFVTSPFKEGKKATGERFLQAMEANVRLLCHFDEARMEEELKRFTSCAKQELRDGVEKFLSNTIVRFIESRNVVEVTELGVETKTAHYFDPESALTFLKVLERAHADTQKDFGLLKSDDSMLLSEPMLLRIRDKVNCAIMNEVERMTKNLIDVEEPKEHLLRLFTLVKSVDASGTNFLSRLAPHVRADIERLIAYSDILDPTLIQERVLLELSRNIQDAKQSHTTLQTYFSSLAPLFHSGRIIPVKDSLKNKVRNYIARLTDADRESANNILRDFGLIEAVYS